jgi:pimeloyl-ACP methyl ester carboxylesterase
MRSLWRPTFLRAFAAAAFVTAAGTAAGADAGLPDEASTPPVKAPNGREVRIPLWATRPGQLVDVGGYRLNLYCFGSGSPTIVLLSGAAWGAVGFAGIQPALAANNRVCSYDRAAVNFSDIGPIERPPDQDLRDLRALLERARLSPPYVLVGWSAGGMLARSYALAHPGEVAGLLTIDGSAFDYEPLPAVDADDWRRRALALFRKCKAAAESQDWKNDPAAFEPCRQNVSPLDFVPEMRAALGEYVHDPRVYAHVLHDLEHIAEPAEALRRARHSLGDLPMRLLFAGEHLQRAEQLAGDQLALAQPDYLAAQYKIASWSSRSLVIIVPAAGHGIQLDRPEAVIGQIDELLAEIRRGGTTRARQGGSGASERDSK